MERQATVSREGPGHPTSGRGETDDSTPNNEGDDYRHDCSAGFTDPVVEYLYEWKAGRGVLRNR